MAENEYNYSKELLGLPHGLSVSVPPVKWKKVVNTAGPTPRFDFFFKLLIFVFF